MTFSKTGKMKRKKSQALKINGKLREPLEDNFDGKLEVKKMLWEFSGLPVGNLKDTVVDERIYVETS